MLSHDAHGAAGARRLRCTPGHQARSGATAIIGPVVVFVLFIGFWEYMHREACAASSTRSPACCPRRSPSSTRRSSTSVRQLLEGLGWTSYAVLVGLGITIVIGMSLAVLMARAVWLERSIYPYLVALQATPVLAIVPIIYSIFGGGMEPRIYVR